MFEKQQYHYTFQASYQEQKVTQGRYIFKKQSVDKVSV